MTKFFQFIKNNWIYLLLGFLLIPVIYKAIKNKNDNSKDTETNAETVMDSIGVSDSQRGAMKKLTIEVAHHLGTSYVWIDPRRWTENDKEVFELLRSLNQKEFDIMKELYFKVYAKGRNLTEDLAKFLDNKYYSQLNLT